MPTKRTSNRSSKGTKHYAVRNKKGQFEDVQTYKRAHGQDLKRKSKAEVKRASESSLREIRETTDRFAETMKRLAKR